MDSKPNSNPAVPGRTSFLDRDEAPSAAGRRARPPALLCELLEGTGVRFDGPEPWDIQVHHPEAYRRILTRGTLGFGDAYMDGLWECEQLDELVTRLIRFYTKVLGELAQIAETIESAIGLEALDLRTIDGPEPEGESDDSQAA